MLNEYRQEELNQMQKCDSLDTFAYQVQEQFGDSFYEIAHQKTKVNNVIFHQFLFGPLFDDCDKCIYTTSRDKWLKVLEEKNDNLFQVYYETTTNFGDDELLVVVCWNNEELERRTRTYEELCRTIQDAVECGDFGYIDGKIDDWRTARAYNNGNEYAYDESTKKEIELPILEGKTYRHAITNPRDKRYIYGVDGVGPESDTQRMGIRDQAYVDQEQIDNDLLNAFYDRVNPDDDYDYIPPANVNTSIQPRFYMEPSDALDDVTEDELEAIDNGALETADAGDPDELEHFDPEEDSAIVPIPEFEEEDDDDEAYFA